MAHTRPGTEDVMELVRELALHAPNGEIARDTVLTDVGFDSIACAEFAAAVQERFGLDLADGEVTAVTTAGQLAEVVDGAAAAGLRDPEVPVGLGRFQGAAKRVVGGAIRWWFDLEVTHPERMPSDGPVVMCMNHESALDIPVAVAASPRPITFMAKKELFRSRGTARFVHELGGFSVERGAYDLRAVEIALGILARRQVLGMYPEGTRTPGVLLPFLPGAAWVALKTGAPLLPAAIQGTEAAMPPHRRVPKRVPIRVSFGEPIAVELVEEPALRRKEALRVTSELRAQVAGMLQARPAVA
jgi:1-acyl-sn-glycerol-3-phosphate acyltransferase